MRIKKGWGGTSLLNRKKVRRCAWGAVLLGLGLSGCVTAPPPYVGQGPYPQVSRGTAVPPVDFLGNVLALPGKFLLWNGDFSNHSVSEETEAKLINYLEYRSQPAFEDTHFHLNRYAPHEDLRSLFKNQYVAWPYRIFIGLPVTLIFDVLLPGRLFPWGDYYNPYTNTVHIYSDDPTIVLHEAGHAYDFSNFPLKGTYALLRFVPFMDLYQEWWASDEAIDYLIDTGDRELEFRAYRTLYPAYGTYVGNYLPLPFGSAVGAVIGHVVARVKVWSRKRYYQEMDAVVEAPGV